MKILNSIINLPRNLVAVLIIGYQKTLSLDHGPLSVLYSERTCRYEPTCSEYTKQAVLKHGVVVGIPIGFWRIVRCNPWSKGGWDPVK